MDTEPETEPGEEERNFGAQPLDAILAELGIGNHELVEASTEQLTHKQVQKGRKGRKLSPKVRKKIAAALKSVCSARAIGRSFEPADLFNYGP